MRSSRPDYQSCGGPPDYRERFKNNLAKALPRIPAVKTYADFAAFLDAGRALGDLHVNFVSVEPYMVTLKEGTHDLIHEAQADPVKFYRVKKDEVRRKGQREGRDQRHRQRCQRLRQRDSQRPRLPYGVVPSGDHGELGDGADRQWLAGIEY